MTQIETKIRKWGNSYGIIVPLYSLDEGRFKENEEIIAILIKKGNVIKETFGKVKFKKSTEQMMKETDEDLYDI